MRKILFLRGGALGDFIVTLPALSLLRERWPTARIELVGNATAAQLAVERGLLDAVHSQHEARWSSLFVDSALPAALAAWFAEFDLIVNYWPDTDGALARHFPVREGQQFLTVSANPSRAPAAAHYCEPLRQLGLASPDYFYRLLPVRRPGVEVGAEISPSQPRSIAIHPGSGSPRKNWPAERWLELVASLPAPLFVILGEAESGNWRSWISTGVDRGKLPTTTAGKPALYFADKLPLDQLVTHLNRCQLFLGHDSGISHLAAACGVPCVLLFGPTDPAMWAPPTPQVHVLQRGPDLKSISVREVCEAVTAALKDRT